MATITKSKRLSILDAFDFLGRRKHVKWVGLETRAVRKRIAKPADDMRAGAGDISDEELVRRLRAEKAEQYGLRLADKWAPLFEGVLRESMGQDVEIGAPKPAQLEPERKVHREAEAEWLPPPEEVWKQIEKGFEQPWWPPDPDSKEYLEAHEAWERREDTLAALRTIMSEHGIGSFLLIAGGDVPLEDSQWHPDNQAFAIDLLTGVCGEGKQKGPTYIEREPFIAVVNSRHPLPSDLDHEARSKGGSRPKYNKSLQKAINSIAGFVGQPITLARVIEWLRETADSENQYTFDPPIPGCDDLYIDGKRLVWKDRESRERDIALKSLERYVERARKTRP